MFLEHLRGKEMKSSIWFYDDLYYQFRLLWSSFAVNNVLYGQINPII
jgi:hypothetical protein